MLNMEMLIVITDRSTSENFVHLFQAHGLPLTLAALGRGTAPPEILNTLLLEESEKTVFISVANSEKVHTTVKEINRDIGIRSPGTSIVLTVLLSSIGGESTAHYLAEEHAVERKEPPMSTEEAFELILVITNEGYGNFAMNAARENGGATGGTILHARGLGMEQAQKFFGISISDEKEILLIACRSRCRNRIMQAVTQKAGRGTKANAVVFSVPVSSVAGLWILQEQKEETCGTD